MPRRFAAGVASLATVAVLAACGQPPAPSSVDVVPGQSARFAPAAQVDQPAVDELGVEVRAADGEVLSAPDVPRTDGVVEAEETGTWAVSDPVSADAYSMVGVTWPEGAAGEQDPTVQVRSRDADGRWSPWTELPVADDEADPGTADAARAVRDGTDPVWVGDAEAVQLRVASEVGLPDDSRLSLVDPGSGHASTGAVTASGGGVEQAVTVAAVRSSSSRAAGAVAAAVPAAAPDPLLIPAAPPIITRAEWGAPSPVCQASRASRIVGAVVHHTASTNSYSTLAQAKAQLRGFFSYHTQSRGWCDIGYNFLVDKWGNVYEGRAGSLTGPVIGVHAGGFNTSTVGVSMIGDYSTLTPPAAMQESVARVLAWRLGQYGVDPQGSLSYTTYGGENSRYSSGTIRLDTVFAHREVAYTACPGEAGYRIMGSLRARAKALVATGVPLTGAIREWYLSSAQAPKLGAATAPERGVAGGAAVQTFVNGTLTVSPSQGVIPTFAFIDAAYRAAGGAGGKLGLPLAAETSAGGAWTQRFAGGSITWSSSWGAVPTFAFIDAAYRAAGGASGKLGAPRSAESYAGDGVWLQRFSGGTITYSPAHGAVPTFAFIDTAYRVAGAATGKLGVPTGPESNTGGAWVQRFSRGTLTYTGSAGAVPTYGFIDERYRADGGPGGKLGAPVAAEAYLGDGRWSQRFAGGTLTFVPANGVVPTYAFIDATYRANGGGAGKLGVPTGPETKVGTGVWTQRFERGSVTFSSAAGAIPTFAFIDATYRASGGPGGSLGAPTAPEAYVGDGAWTQRFAGGVITYTPAGGAVATLGGPGA